MARAANRAFGRAAGARRAGPSRRGERRRRGLVRLLHHGRRDPGRSRYPAHRGLRSPERTRRAEVARDRRGRGIWVAAYHSRTLLRLDPKTSEWSAWPLPGPDAKPFGLAFDAQGDLR